MLTNTRTEQIIAQAHEVFDTYSVGAHSRQDTIDDIAWAMRAIARGEYGLAARIARELPERKSRLAAVRDAILAEIPA